MHFFVDNFKNFLFRWDDRILISIMLMSHFVVFCLYIHCVSKNTVPFFIFAMTLLILSRFWQFLAVIHLRIITVKPIFYFPPHLFSAPLLYLLRQASYLTDIHSDEHQNRIVKSGKSRQKTLTKHAKTSQDSQSKFSKCRPLAFTQARSCTRHWSMALSMTVCCIPDHAAIRRHFVNFIGNIYYVTCYYIICSWREMERRCMLGNSLQRWR